MRLNAHNCVIAIITIILFSTTLVFARPIPTDSAGFAEQLLKKIHYAKRYGFIHYDQNHLEWQSYQAIAPFFEKLKQTQSRKVNILHIGDSHVQYDLQCGQMRNRLQELFGYGGRGFMSPYSAARTHATYDYVVTHRGKWQAAKNTHYKPSLPLGVTGITVKTSDVFASFKFKFLISKEVQKSFRKVKIYAKQSAESFDLKIKAGDFTEPILVDLNTPTGKPYVEVLLPAASQQIEFIVHKTAPEQKYFECYGIYVESDEDSGIVYSSVGINGAALSSILKQSLLSEQVKDLSPDLIVVDLGVNDFYMNNTADATTESRLRRLVQRLKEAAPKAVILITNVQDVYYYRRNITACVKYAELTRKVALENNCAYYDYFAVSGGKYAMQKWYSYGLAKSDKIHLTNKGYRVKGELYLNALLNSFYTLMTHTAVDNFIVQKEKPKVVIPTNLPEEKATKSYYKTVAYKAPTTAKKQIHTVRYGESLGYLSLLYGVKIKDIQSWNKLPNYFIYPNQKLVIHSNKQIKKPANNTTVKGGRVIHRVVSGDTLWAISRKYGVTVAHIKKMNGMQSDKLSIGKKLVIK